MASSGFGQVEVEWEAVFGGLGLKHEARRGSSGEVHFSENGFGGYGAPELADAAATREDPDGESGEDVGDDESG